MSQTIFLTAEWRDLVLLNFSVPSSLIGNLVPAGTEVDQFDGTTFVSIVGFRFIQTRVLGLPVPCHRNFEEVNLRFYVRYRHHVDGWRRGVVFVRELVPKRAIAWVARVRYNEPYRHVPMNHRISHDTGGAVLRAEYTWQMKGNDFGVGGTLAHSPAPVQPNTSEEFITEHFWGYTRQRDGGTTEYRVEHPSWNVATLRNPYFHGDPGLVYGHMWREALSQPPRTALYAEGSPVTVALGQRIAHRSRDTAPADYR